MRISLIAADRRLVVNGRKQTKRMPNHHEESSLAEAGSFKAITLNMRWSGRIGTWRYAFLSSKTQPANSEPGHIALSLRNAAIGFCGRQLKLLGDHRGLVDQVSCCAIATLTLFFWTTSNLWVGIQSSLISCATNWCLRPSIRLIKIFLIVCFLIFLLWGRFCDRADGRLMRRSSRPWQSPWCKAGPGRSGRRSWRVCKLCQSQRTSRRFGM